MVSGEALAADAPRKLDARVLNAGTTLRFVLLLLLFAASSLSMVTDVIDAVLDPDQHFTGCALAAGVDPTSGGWGNAYTRLMDSHNFAAYEACVGRYAPHAAWVAIAVTCGLLGTATALYWWLPAWKGRHSRVVPIDELDLHGRLRPVLDELVGIAGLTRSPHFVVDPAAATASAVVFGRRRRPTVCLHGGLIALCVKDANRFRTVVLHELAHIRNGDVDVTYATVALWRVFLCAVLIPHTVFLVVSGALDTAPSSWGNTTHYGRALGLSVLTVALVYLARADVLRNRELYADLDAARWGAEFGWEHEAAAAAGKSPTGGRSRRMLASFLELWRTHPKWTQRQHSLTDPATLFGLTALPMFLTGVGADIAASQLGPLVHLSYTRAALAQGLLIAALVIAIAGVATWRAVVHAVLTGRRVPSGVRTGFWLGLGLALGELTHDQVPGNHWLPVHPEAVLVLPLVTMLVMGWAAQNAELWTGTWHGRTLRTVMALGLAAPWLIVAFVLYRWAGEASVYANGWPYSTSGILQLYDLPGLPPPQPRPLLTIAAVITIFPGTDAGQLLWCGVAGLWIVPLCAWTARSSSAPPRWLIRALPGGQTPVPLARGVPSSRHAVVAGLTGGLATCLAVAAEMAAMHAHAHGHPNPLWGPYVVSHAVWRVLVISGGMAVAALVATMLAERYWLVMGALAAGFTALVSLPVAFLFAAADGCLGPLDTMTNVCAWRPAAAWPDMQTVMEYGAGLGAIPAAVLTLAVCLLKLLMRRRRTHRESNAVETLRVPGLRRRRVGIAVAVAAAIGVTTAVSTVAPSSGASAPSPTSDTLLKKLPYETSSSVETNQLAAWAEYGGNEWLTRMMTTIKEFSSAQNDVAHIESRLPLACRKIAPLVRGAASYFTLPDHAGEQKWSAILTMLRQAGNDCQRVLEQPSGALLTRVDKELITTVDLRTDLIDWLKARGALK